MSSLFENIDVDDIKNNAKGILDFTGTKAKGAYDFASEKYNNLDDDIKSAIKIGVIVFGVVLLVAGCFYLLGKKAGRKEEHEFEYEEWDG